MSAAEMAAFESRVGTALIRKLANASADFGLGLVVEGLLDDPSLNSVVGGLSMIDRDPTFDALAADFGGRTLCRGDAVAITLGPDVIDYKLRYAPVRGSHLGTLSMALEKDPLA